MLQKTIRETAVEAPEIHRHLALDAEFKWLQLMLESSIRRAADYFPSGFGEREFVGGGFTASLVCGRAWWFHTSPVRP